MRSWWKTTRPFVNCFTCISALPGSTSRRKPTGVPRSTWRDAHGSNSPALDVMMPGLDGVSICRALRTAGANVATPILMLTARDSEADTVIGLESGADHDGDEAVRRPVTQARVLAVTRRHGRHEAAAAGTEAPSELASGMTIDLARRQVMVRGEEVELTRQEFDLLPPPAREPSRHRVQPRSSARDGVDQRHRHGADRGHGGEPTAQEARARCTETAADPDGRGASGTSSPSASEPTPTADTGGDAETQAFRMSAPGERNYAPISSREIPVRSIALDRSPSVRSRCPCHVTQILTARRCAVTGNFGVGPITMIPAGSISCVVDNQRQLIFTRHAHIHALGRSPAVYRAAIVNFHTVSQNLEDDRSVVSGVIIHADLGAES